jgi:hypothetical protein
VVVIGHIQQIGTNLTSCDQKLRTKSISETKLCHLSVVPLFPNPSEFHRWLHPWLDCIALQHKAYESCPQSLTRIC